MKRNESLVNAWKELKYSHNPINLGWSDRCVADPHCDISAPKADGQPLEEVGSGVSQGNAHAASGPAVIESFVWCRLPGHSNLQ